MVAGHRRPDRQGAEAQSPQVRAFERARKGEGRAGTGQGRQDCHAAQRDRQIRRGRFDRRRSACHDLVLSRTGIGSGLRRSSAAIA
jgi:hypothetical protein